jgi:hypothetical protein
MIRKLALVGLPGDRRRGGQRAPLLTHLGGVKGIVSALLAAVLWPPVLAGVNLRIH